MPSPAAKDLDKAKSIIAGVYDQLEKLHPRAILAALDFYADDFQLLREAAEHELNALADQEKSNA